jgi:hypothetical protein
MSSSSPFLREGMKLLRWLNESLLVDTMFVIYGILWRRNLSGVHIRQTYTRYCYLNETLSSFTQISFESKIVYMAKDLILAFLCLCTSLLRILYEECKHTLDSTWTWVSQDFCCRNVSVLHQWFFFDVHCLIGPVGSLDVIVQPSLQLQLWERWSYHSVLPQGLGSTWPPSNCWVPMLDNI